MKRVVNVFGGIILAALIGLSVTACDTGGPTGGGTGGGTGIEMVRVGPGVFYLGQEEGTAGFGNTTPISSVTMSGFYMGRFPVTQGQFYEVMGFNPSWFTTALGRPPTSWSTDLDTWGPAPTSWNDPLRARWDAVRIVPGSTGYRLPTEAQWEFAAKGGPLGGPYTFSGSNNINAVARHWGNSGIRTQEVGGLQANRLGIHDMSGNVYDWVWDRYGPYTAEPETDPSGASWGSFCVIRGGSWNYSPHGFRSVDRIYGNNPFYRNTAVGFRVARPL